MFLKLVSFAPLSFLMLMQHIEIRPKLAPGDKFRLEISRTREDSSRPQSNATSRTLVDVEVLSADARGFILDWIPGETAFDNPQVLQDPTVAAAARAIKGIHFRVSLNADGEFTGLANEAEVRPKLQAMVGAVVQDLAARLPAAERKTFEELIGRLLSPAALISSATRDAQIYTSLNGASLAAGESLEATLQQPSPVGGGALPATFRVRMDSATVDSASLASTTTYDKDALLKMTLGLAQQAGAAIPPEELAKIPPMQLIDDGKYEFDRTLGLMRKVTINRRTTLGNQVRLDGWTITLITPPKR
jgi:hypothetical protein